MKKELERVSHIMRKQLDKILQDSTKGKTKEVALNLGCHTNTVDREMDGSVKYNCLEKTIAFMDCSIDDAIIQELSASQGGVFVHVPDVTPSGGGKIISELLKEFSELTGEIADSFQDGKIDKSEIVKMRKELADINSVTEAFFICAERGDYNDS